MERQVLNPFLENWKRVLGTAPSPLKSIRVLSGVATILNGKVLLRCPVGDDTPDGFYKMAGTENRLIPVTDWEDHRMWETSSYWNMRSSELYRFFPDVEQFNPRFEGLVPFCCLDKSTMRGMISICEHVRRYDGTVLMGDQFITMRQKPKEDITLVHNFSIPNGDEYCIGPEELKLALIEMMRYDQVYLSRKQSDRDQPLVLGLNWGQCALVKVSVCNQYREG